MERKWVSLNVGGVQFMTNRTTLIRNLPSTSPLYSISSNSTNVPWDRDSKGSYLIDRDSECFRSILNFLRTGQLFLGRDTSEEALLLEAEYFNVPELIKLLTQRISERTKLSANSYQQVQVFDSLEPATRLGYRDPFMAPLVGNPFGRANEPEPAMSPRATAYYSQECLSSYVNNIMGTNPK